MTPVRNGDLEKLTEDVSYIKTNLTLSVEQLSNAVLVLAQRADNLANNISRMIYLWERSIPLKLALLMILITALAFGGRQVIELLAGVISFK